eukprot:s5178_g2.t2
MGSDLKDPRAWPLQCPSNGMTRDDRKGWPLDVEQQLLGCILGEWLCSLQQQVILRIALANDGWCFCSNDVSSAELCGRRVAAWHEDWMGWSGHFAHRWSPEGDSGMA